MYIYGLTFVKNGSDVDVTSVIHEWIMTERNNVKNIIIYNKVNYKYSQFSFWCEKDKLIVIEESFAIQ